MDTALPNTSKFGFIMSTLESITNLIAIHYYTAVTLRHK